jgi:contractile injection system tape measure protein
MEQDIYIPNAGLVILNAYLPYFFQRCGYLDDEVKLMPDKAKSAALLLQYVYNPNGVYLEEEMVLNKILCGLEVDEELPDNFEANETEVSTSDQMLNAIIVQWEMIKNSSPDGFREFWLHREGKLTKKGPHWELLVEQRPFDILLDSIPFTLSPVKYAWMVAPIHVIWR